MRTILAICLAALCAACANLQGFHTSTSQVTPRGAVAIHHAPADLRATVVIQTPQQTTTTRTTTTAPNGVVTVVETSTTAPSQTSVCPQPPGDVAYSRTAETILKLTADAPASGTDATAEAALRAGAAAMELEGRTQSVLLARDMLTYTCVQTANRAMTGAESQANFSRIAEMLERFAQAEQVRAGAQAVQAAASARGSGVNPETVAALLGNIQASRETLIQSIVNKVAPNGQFNRALLSNLAAREPVRTLLGSRADTLGSRTDVAALRTFLTQQLTPDELSQLSVEAAK